MLRQKARPYLFSNSVAPSVVGASLKVFDMIMSDTSLVDTVRRNTKLFRGALTEAGFELRGDPEHPICPVMIYDDRKAGQMADAILDHGVYVIGFTYPVVPQGLARIRVQLSAAHTEDQVMKAADAFIAAGRKFGVVE